jgi:type VI protein secretion system component VasK
MDSDAFLVLWTLAGLAGILLMWRRGYLAEYLGCAFLVSALSTLLPVLLGGAVLLVSLSLRNEREQTNAATETEKQPEAATPKGYAEASRRADAEAVKVPVG